MSSVPIAILKPWPGCAEQPVVADAAVGQAQRAQRVRRDDVDALRCVEPRRAASTMKADRPCGAGRLRRVRANTT